jgi:hypothetical protein
VPDIFPRDAANSVDQGGESIGSEEAKLYA